MLVWRWEDAAKDDLALVEEQVKTREFKEDDTSVIDLDNQDDDEDDDTQTIDLKKTRSMRRGRTSEAAPYCSKCELDVSDAPSIVCPKCGSTPLCGYHFNEDQGACAPCTRSAFSETTTVDVSAGPPPQSDLEESPQPVSEPVVQSRASVEFTRPKFDHRTLSLNDIVEVATAKSLKRP